MGLLYLYLYLYLYIAENTCRAYYKDKKKYLGK